MTTGSIAPGPGAYGQDKQKVADLSWSMGAKLGDHKKLDVPGPGTYNN